MKHDISITHRDGVTVVHVEIKDSAWKTVVPLLSFFGGLVWLLVRLIEVKILNR